jgi:hypothetical protein
MTDKILTELRAALAFVTNERENRENEGTATYEAQYAESSINAAIAGGERLTAELRALPTEWAELCEQWKAERDAAIAERDELKIWADQCQTDRDIANDTLSMILNTNTAKVIAERDELRMALAYIVNMNLSRDQLQEYARAALTKDTPND